MQLAWSWHRTGMELTRFVGPPVVILLDASPHVSRTRVSLCAHHSMAVTEYDLNVNWSIMTLFTVHRPVGPPKSSAASTQQTCDDPSRRHASLSIGGVASLAGRPMMVHY